jgi:ketose-bisphosphate aldolase
MSLEKVSCILKDGDRNGYGVAAINIFNYESIAWVIQVAEEERVPVIIQFYPGFTKLIPISTVAAITKDLISTVKVPIGLHLDHSHSFEQALAGARYGFQSIMIDGSALNFQENVNLTREVVKAAHALGIEVEAELGHVGSGNNPDDFLDSHNFTSPQDALEFIELTKVDALAISVGNGHGQYIKTPSLDFDRINEVNKLIDTHLVLHGCSDIPVNQLQKSVQLGMNKFNIATEYNRAIYNSLQTRFKDSENKGYMYGSLLLVEAEVKEFIRDKIKILNPKGYRF